MVKKMIAVGCALVFLASCETDRSPARLSRRGRVYMFRGFAGLEFGLDGFARELRRSGINATCYNAEWGPVIADRIERDHARVSPHEPLVLIGYSTGSVTVL